MTNEQTTTLVLRNEAGDYFLLPQATLEEGRVPADHKTEVERLVAEAEGDDVSGHLFFQLFGVETGAARALLKGLPGK